MGTSFSVQDTCLVCIAFPRMLPPHPDRNFRTYNREGGTIDIEIGKISHHRAGATGNLKLTVWATDERFKGGTIKGHKLGSVTKAPLKSGYNYTDVKNTAKYTPPPDGTYFITIALSEYGSDETYSIVDFHTMTEPCTFKKP